MNRRLVIPLGVNLLITPDMVTDTHLSDSPLSRSRTDPYSTNPSDQLMPRVGDCIPISDEGDIPGFRQQTSSGPLWRALTLAGDETEMTVVSVLHNQSYYGQKVVQVECKIKGYSFPVLAFFRHGVRVA